MFDWFPVSAVHLWIFIFASGYFYKEEAEEQVFRFIWKKVQHLIIPMYIYIFIYGLIRQIIAINGPQMGGVLSFSDVSCKTNHYWIFVWI